MIGNLISGAIGFAAALVIFVPTLAFSQTVRGWISALIARYESGTHAP